MSVNLIDMAQAARQTARAKVLSKIIQKVADGGTPTAADLAKLTPEEVERIALEARWVRSYRRFFAESDQVAAEVARVAALEEERARLSAEVAAKSEDLQKALEALEDFDTVSGRRSSLARIELRNMRLGRERPTYLGASAERVPSAARPAFDAWRAARLASRQAAEELQRAELRASPGGLGREQAAKREEIKGHRYWLEHESGTGKRRFVSDKGELVNNPEIPRLEERIARAEEELELLESQGELARREAAIPPLGEAAEAAAEAEEKARAAWLKAAREL